MILENGLVIHIWEWNEKAKELGLTPKAEIVDYCFTGQRLEDELLLGPAYAMSKVLDQTKLSLNDIDVFEIHEAFAGQVLTNIKCLADDEFCKIELQKEHIALASENLRWRGIEKTRIFIEFKQN